VRVLSILLILSLSASNAIAQSRTACTYFTVVLQDRLDNITNGLSEADQNWFQKKIAKKYPRACYADPGPAVPVVFSIRVTPAVYHGTRTVRHQSVHDDPVNGTVTGQNGNMAQVNGTVQTTTTTSEQVPVSFQYGLFTLEVRRKLDDGRFEVARRFQQKGLYKALYGVPLGGKGHHPTKAVIEQASKWINDGGLTDPRQSAIQ